ncbi:MAG: DNA polymerase I [Anaerolineae bacterium]|nr:DNA polymerase I [Anaerolineae bacterium]
MTSRPLFIIIDGYALAYRQFYALPERSFSTGTGLPTNAIWGFARTILDTMQNDKPQYFAVSFDRGLSGREVLYGDYKGTREKMPDSLRVQIEYIEKLVDAFNMPRLALEGYEADDVIGSVVGQAEAQGVDVRVMTGDRDILQLLSEHIRVQIPQRNGPDIIYDIPLFREKYSLEPWQLVELKALMGDSSDNIPGVKGIGEKGATALLQLYNDIDGIYANIDAIKGATQQKLIDGREMAYLSRTLATIKRDVPFKLDLQACVSHDFDAKRVDDLFAFLEFRSLRQRLPKAAEQPTLFDMGSVQDAPPKGKRKRAKKEEPAEEEQPAELLPPVAETVTVQTEEALNNLVALLRVAKGIAFDTETTGIDQMSAELVGISLAVEGERGYYIPVGHSTGTQLPLNTVIDALRPALTDPAIPKYGHNAAYDMVMLARYGIEVTPVTFDTMVAEWLRNAESKNLGLKNLAAAELAIQMTKIDVLLGKGKKQVTMDNVPIERAAPYAADDAAVTYRLTEKLHQSLVDKQLIPYYEALEIPLIPVIAAMERVGIVLDVLHLRGVTAQLAVMLHNLEETIRSLTGTDNKFNINSPKQLNEVLFGKLGLSVKGVKKTIHGYSTDASVLEDMRGDHPVIPYLLEHRELTKLKGTYADALPELINPLTGRVHTSYNQTGAATGRLSSSNPNLQNIPIRTELGREIRRGVIAPPGMLLLSVDYSQVELRILAHLSQDATLLEAFAQGQDIHAATAAKVYGIPLESVTKDQRGFAKRVNFGLIYGMGPHRLARDSNLTFSEARNFIRTYFDRLPGVERYLEETKQRARREPLKTLFGRPRAFSTLMNPESRASEIQAQERVAINMPIQGSAADIMRRAMIDVHAALGRSRLGARIVLQVHDELVLEVPEDEVDQTSALVVEIMEGAYKLDAPLRANAQFGENWRDMEPI